MSTLALIQQLLAEAQSREDALEDKRRAFERLQEMEQSDIADIRIAARVLEHHEQKANPKPFSPETLSALQQPTLPTINAKVSFIDVVEKTIEGIDANITTALVFDMLQAQGVPLGDDPRTKISTALARLEKRKALVKEVAGGIGRAHSYRKANK